MNTRSAFPFHLYWTSQELTEAVPLRLHALVRFDAAADEAANATAAPRSRPSGLRRGYLQRNELPAFVRVR